MPQDAGEAKVTNSLSRRKTYMCRSTAAPLMALAGVAGTSIGVAIAVIREKADRRSFAREARKKAEAEAEAKTMASRANAEVHDDEPDEKND